MAEKIQSALIAGGDLRQIYAANELKNLGYKVFAFGFDENSKFDEEISQTNDIEIFEKVDLILFPLGVCKESKLNTPLFGGEISLESCLERAKNNLNCKIFGGNLSENDRKIFEKYDLEIEDFFKNESLVVANAVLTAEGSIEIAIRESLISLWQSECLVLGYGRIAKILAERLQHFGANVSVFLRNPEQKIWAETKNLKIVNFENLSQILPKQNFIFNTIPSQILTENFLKNISKETLLIELASKPYGIEISAAENLGLNFVLASGLPGKCSPKSAGILIAKTIENLHRG